MSLKTALARMKEAMRSAPVTKTHRLANPAEFFNRVRVITTRLDQVQVDTINGLLKAAAHWPISWLAYGLATAWHEARLKPIREWGLGKGKPYGLPGKYGQAPYGRGLVQLTWDGNYEWADKELGLGGELLKNFDLALKPSIATEILVKGMEQGAFTGRALGTYLKGEIGDYEAFRKARRIINGTDRDRLIAGHALEFQRALEEGGWQ